MTVIVPEGEFVGDALQYIKELFASYMDEYPVLKSPLNLYCTLQSSDNRICPENERTLILTHGKVVDPIQEERNKALAFALSGWKEELEQNASAIRAIEEKLQKDQKYLATANNMKKNQKLIASRKK